MTASTTARPNYDEYPPAFGKYIQLVPSGDLHEILQNQLTDFLELLSGLSEPESLRRHAPYTWSIRQVVGHVADCERVFGHRALWIARGHTTPLASFDENAFMAASSFDRWPLSELLAEFEHVRRSHVCLLRHLEPADWIRRGVVSDHPATVRALAFVIAGHAQHHLNILHRRLAAESA